MITNTDERAKAIHAANVSVGWWDEWPNKLDRHDTAMMLTVTELAEAAEGARKSLMDDHLPQYDMFAVELADASIRLLDLAGAYFELGIMPVGADHGHPSLQAYINAYTEAPWLEASMRKLPNPLAQLYQVVKSITEYDMGEAVQVADGLGMLAVLAEVHGIDLDPIIDAKLAYNAERLDHKRESRAAKGGKKW
jgi:hypothetical protein